MAMRQLISIKLAKVNITTSLTKVSAQESFSRGGTSQKKWFITLEAQKDN